MVEKKTTYQLSTQQEVSLQAIAADYLALAKHKLNLIVTLTAVLGFLFAGGAKPGDVLWLFLGGYFVTAAANTLNQIFEKEYDAKMKRTKNRPLPTKRVTVPEAWLFAGITAVIGLVLLYLAFNPLTAFLGALSLFIYSFIYTPLKRIHPVAVFVGAIPGAMPPLIGFAAAVGTITVEAYIFFAMQFLWQFPHFWAIAWLAFDDYKKAGFKLLPSGEKDKSVAVQSIVFILGLVLLSVMPAYFGMTSIWGSLICVIASVMYGIPAVQLLYKQTDKEAKRLMFASFIYLPIVFLAIILV